MRPVKAKELRSSPITSCRKLSNFKEELFNLRFQLATRQLEPDAPAEVRKSIARIKTVLHERELAKA